MGQYDDLYEATRLADARSRKEDLLRWIPEKLEDMSNPELEVMYEVAQNVEAYHGFMQVIKRIAASKRI